MNDLFSVNGDGTVSFKEIELAAASSVLTVMLGVKATKNAVAGLEWEELTPFSDAVKSKWLYARKTLGLPVSEELLRHIITACHAMVVHTALPFVLGCGWEKGAKPVVRKPKEFLASLSDVVQNKLWLRSRWHEREGLARYMPARTLPYALAAIETPSWMANRNEEERWRKIVGTRLRKE